MALGKFPLLELSKVKSIQSLKESKNKKRNKKFYFKNRNEKVFRGFSRQKTSFLDEFTKLTLLNELTKNST